MDSTEDDVDGSRDRAVDCWCSEDRFETSGAIWFCELILDRAEMEGKGRALIILSRGFEGA
jgi:hypothetical protein